MHQDENDQGAGGTAQPGGMAMNPEIWRYIFDAIADLVFLHDTQFRVLLANRAYCREAGVTEAEVLGKPYWEVFPPGTGPLPGCKEAAIGKGDNCSLEEVSVGAKLFQSTGYTVCDDKNRPLYSLHIFRDITAQRRAVATLAESEERFRLATETAGDAIVIKGQSGKITEWNGAAEKMFGYSKEEALGRVLHDFLPPYRYREAATNAMKHFATAGDGAVIDKTIELVALHKNGTEFPIELSLSTMQLQGTWYAIGIVRDISERKHAEQALRDEKTFSDTLIQSLPDIFYLLDRQGGLLRWNKHLEELVGLSHEELSATNVINFIQEEDKPLVTQKIQDAIKTGSSKSEARLISTQGVRYYVLAANRVETMLGPSLIGIGVDITELKSTEDTLRAANRALITLSAANQVLVQASAEDELLQAVTSVIVNKGGYPMAAVGYAGDTPEKIIRFMAWAGMEESKYFETGRPAWVGTEQGQFPIAKAIRTGTPQICRDIASDTGFKPWRDSALARGYVSNIVLPLSSGGKTFGGLSIYSSEKDAFVEDEVHLLEKMANDLSYGIITLRARIEHDQHAVLLRQGLEQSIQTIASTVEARDPYTAGHQRRVGELATAIAREMGLPEDQINGIHLAAIIHDLGKIQIPAEILVKPGKLTDIELMLVKTHPQAGYNILKNVKFPWPIADIVLQHHERMDGSGYPQGLKSGQILLESRIMAVADVVEAISSHRPYRPALGIEAALNEIKRGRGSAYDPAVVDTCLTLFAEKGFTFSSQSS
jgi:PAS domain S-box-containing protein